MSDGVPSRPPGFISTVRVLLAASARRAAGRRIRQRDLLWQRKGNGAADWSALGHRLFLSLMCILHAAAALTIITLVAGANRSLAEQRGLMVVEPWFLQAARHETDILNHPTRRHATADASFLSDCHQEAVNLTAEHSSQNALETERRLLATFHHRGPDGFVERRTVFESFRTLPRAGALPNLLGSLVLLWWSMMLVFQGEGLELDIQRRRHPMWEWLLSHPVPPGAVFMAEMLAPLAANPLLQSAPLFVGVLYGVAYGPWHGAAASILIGMPVAVAASCLGKALEIGAMLRFSARSRGAVIGLMGWVGYVSMALFVFAAFAPDKTIAVTILTFQPLTVVPWPWIGFFLGVTPGSGFAFLSGVLSCALVAASCIAVSAQFTVWAARKGLGAPSETGSTQIRSVNFGRNALYRKEALWFARDRSALLQAILVPMTLAGFQLFNLRGLAAHAQGSWNGLCGTAVIFGTYFLWVLGPRSLASDGRALWIATTWPQGIEALLKAKAWLWAWVATVIVAFILLYALYCFPADWWKILAVGLGWLLFARSMSAKAVTLAAAVSESGEATPIPWGRRAAAQLGMTTFCVGILTQRFDLAVTGIVYSSMTAAAMWQNFRARLPYLFDPWSERLPAAPTLMHAMIAISALVELGAVITGVAVGVASFDGPAAVAVALAIAYAMSATVVSAGTIIFLEGRGVSLRDVWLWSGIAPPFDIPKVSSWLSQHASRAFLLPLLIGCGTGIALGLLAYGYLSVLRHIPAFAVQLHQMDLARQEVPQLRLALFVIAVFGAPFAEEFLFRGLLFRALDREWGGWRAVLGSAAFFASYHPVLSWLPVATLGTVNALLFRRTGRLGPAILAHMAYNALVMA